MTLCTVGYGDVAPTSTDEYTLVIVYMICNFGLSAYIVANVTQLVSQAGEDTRLFRNTMKDLQNYCSTNDLPRPLVEELRSYMLLKVSPRLKP